MDWITTLDDLHARYGTPAMPAMVKVTAHLTPSYRAFIDRSRFCVLSTVGPEGTDGSPRGDQGPVVKVLAPRTLALPDWKGNERIDSLRNIVRDGRVSVIFLIPGSTTAIRVNGRARLTADPDLCDSFERDGKHPRTVIIIAVDEVYSQCARAMATSARRSGMVGYNLQSVRNTETHIIVTYQVTTQGFDRDHLGPMAAAAQKALVRDDLHAITDKGYFSGADSAAQKSSPAMRQASPRRSHARSPRAPRARAPRAGAGIFAKADFLYDRERDVSPRPAGE